LNGEISREDEVYGIVIFRKNYISREDIPLVKISALDSL
jgi:hypothetical protein